MIITFKSTSILNVTIKIKFSIDLIHLKTLNNCYSKTTHPNELKLRELIEWVNNDSYTDFLSFHKDFRILSFKLYRGLLWSCKYPSKLTELQYLLI